MTVNEKIKTIDSNIEGKKAQYGLSSGNVRKYEFLTGKDVLPEKGLLEKAATIKRFQYSSLGNELKKQTDIAKKEYQGLDTIYECDKKEDDETNRKPTIKKYSKSNLIYSSKHSFYKYYNIKRFNSHAFESKYF